MKNAKVFLNKWFLICLHSLIFIACSNANIPDYTKTITGFALKADSSKFDDKAKVIAIDSNGNCAFGTVDTNGKYLVTLKGSPTSGKKAKGISGNIYLKVSDNNSIMILVIPEEETNFNLNLITFVSSHVFLNESRIDYSFIFNEAESAIGNSDNGEIGDESTLKQLAATQEITKYTFKEVATSISNALFGFDSNGNDSLNVEHYLTGSLSEKEITLIKVAANITENIFDSAVSAANNPSHTDFYFNKIEFYQALGKELADEAGVANDNMFTDFLDSVIKSQEIKDGLNVIADQLNSYVVEVETNPLATLDITIPQIAVSAPTFNITLARDVDAVTYSISGGSTGDSTSVTISVFDGTELKALITLPITFNGSTLIAGTTLVTNTQEKISLEIKNTKAIVDDIIDLSIALSEAKIAFKEAGYKDISDNLPETTSEKILHVSCSPVKRSGVDNVSTYITFGLKTVFSMEGIDLN